MIPPIGAVSALPAMPLAATQPSTPAPGFGNALMNGLQQVSDFEHHADALIADVAIGGQTQVHEVMTATTESALAVDMLVQVRDRALGAYTEIMRMQL